MENLLKEIEKCEFECEAGSLKGCRAWQELKKRIMSEKGKKEARKMTHIERMELELEDCLLYTSPSPRD